MGFKLPFSVFKLPYINNFSLSKVKSVLSFKSVFHIIGIKSAVDLSTQTVNGGAFSEVEYSALQGVGVRRLSHFAAESVNFTHKVSL